MATKFPKKPERTDIEKPDNVIEFPKKEAVSEDWIPLAELAPEPPQIDFPLELLPTFLREYVEEVAGITELPTGAIAALSLSAVAAAAGGTIRIPSTNGGNRPCVLWTMLLGESRSGKSLALGLLAKPLSKAEAQSREEYEERAKAQAVELGRAKRRLQDAESRKFNAETQGDDERELQNAMDLVARIEEEIGKPREILAMDVTPEKIPDVLQGCGFRGITMYSTEAKEIINIASGLYSSGTVRIDHLLKGHDADDIQIKRKGAPDVFVPDAVIGFLGGIQPGVLRNTSGWEEFQERGLSSRMHFIDPGPERIRDFDKENIDAGIQDRFMEVMRMLTDFDPPAPHVFQPEEDTQGAVRDIRRKMEHLVQPGKEYWPIRGAAKTAGEYTWRIAGLLATARAAEQQVDFGEGLNLPPTISSDEIREAARIVEEYLLPTDLIFAEGEQGERVQVDIDLLNKLAAKYGSNPITATDCKATLPRQHRTPEGQQKLRARWQELGLIQMVENVSGIRFLIHPEIVEAAESKS